MIPKSCPCCKEQESWKEVINPFTTGIPLGKHIRINLALTRGLRFYHVKYQCGRCGYTEKYDYRDNN